MMNMKQFKDIFKSDAHEVPHCLLSYHCIISAVEEKLSLKVIQGYSDPKYFPLLLTLFTKQKVNFNTEGICFME